MLGSLSRRWDASAGRWLARGRGLTTQLFLFIILPVTALLLAIPFVSLTLHAQGMRALVGQRDQRTAKSTADAIAEQLNHRASAIRGLALYATLASPERAIQDYKFLLADFEGGIAVLQPDGKLLAASNPSEIWQHPAVRELLSQTAGSTQPHLSPTFRESSSGRPLVLAAARSPAGWVALGAFFPDSLVRRTLATTLAPGDESSLWLIDGSGQVLFQWGAPPSTPEPARHPGVAEALRGEAGTTYRDAEGNEHVVAYSPVAPLGWALVIEEPWETVDNPLLRWTQAAPLLLVPIVLFGLGTVGFGLWQVVQPLQALERQAIALAGDRFDAIEKPVGGIAEIRRLQAELIDMAHRLKASQQSLRDYLNVVTNGQEDERRRLARELHDSTVQSLIALDQQGQLAQMALKQGTPNADRLLAEARHMIAALITEVRRVIRALRPIYLEDFGLISAIEMLSRDLQSGSGVRVVFSADDDLGRLTPEREIAVYRIVQEAFSNVARHAQAQTVRIRAAGEPGMFVVRIQDDGRGFDLPANVTDLARAGHYGLMGMRERAELIGASLVMASLPSHGTTFELRVPLASPPT